MIASFSLLRPEEIAELPPKLTLFLFPVGGLEQHGPHLPLGIKLFQAEEWTKALAVELQTRLPLWNFILMPVLPLSVDSVTNRFALNVRPHVVRDAIVDQCDQLKRHQFQNFAAVSSHLTPKQLSALEDASKIVTSRALFRAHGSQLISVSGALVDAKDIWDSPMIAIPKEHGGASDTLFLLKRNPALVSERYKTLPTQPRPKASVARFIQFLKGDLDGYWGNPAGAESQVSDAVFENQIQSLAERMVPWLEQNKGKGIFNSGYRYFPLNGSFFKAYFLALLFFMFMLVWVIWSVKDVFEK